MADSVEVDVVVVGGGLGGVAAALAAASSGVSVMLVEPGSMLGGQLTAQGVCTPDELYVGDCPVVESFGSTASYRDLRHRIREWYRQNTTLSAAGQAMNPLNIGQCWVNTGFAVEPAVAVQIMSERLTEVGVSPLLNAGVSGSPLSNRLVGDLTVIRADGTSVTVAAKFVLDATETGELLPMLGLPYVIGAEAQSDTTEPAAPPEAHPEWVQPITYPMALIHRPAGEDHTIAKPDGYDQIKAAQHFTLVDGDIQNMFTGSVPFWTYRRVIDQALFNDARYACDLATINVGSNDYMSGIYPDDANPGNDQSVLAAARQTSLAYLYWLQTEAPRDDGCPTAGWPELMPATDFFNTPDAIAPAPYIRESRRILPLVRVIQQDIGQATNPGMRARNFNDSCGLGNYMMDVHAGANGGPGMWAGTRPYQIAAGALVPAACDNLIAAGKCLGVSHITNGAYRLHPQEWNIGEAAGVLAAFCVQTGCTPAQAVSADPLLAQYQSALLGSGVPLFWWSDALGSSAWADIQMCGVRGVFQGYPDSLEFKPDDPFDDAAKAAVEAELGQAISWPAGALTRAEAAQAIATQMQWVV